MDWTKAKEELRKPLDPSAIKPAPQGKFGEYVEGYHVIREANRIFGEDGWSYEITRLQQVSRVEAGNGNVRVGYLCAVKVTIDGVVREGSAVGNGAAKPDNEADAHESAVKEAETDAMKRALRTFGNTFGLALYEKDKAKREVGVVRDPRKVADGLITVAAKANTIGQLNEWIGAPKFDAAWQWLADEHPEIEKEVKAAVEAARERLDPAMQHPEVA